MPSGNYKAEEAQREQRRKTVAANLVAGLTVGEIAEALGVHRQTIYQDIKRILQRWRDEQVDLISTQRMLDVRRIDRMMNAIWQDCQAGKLATLDRMVKLLDRRAKLLGLDTPTKGEDALGALGEGLAVLLREAHGVAVPQRPPREEPEA